MPQTPILMGTTKLYVPYPEVEALADRRLLVLDDHSSDPMLVEVDGEAVPFTVGTVPEFLEVTLRSATTRDLDGASAHMLGNVVPATHGETVADEVIGDGDSSVALQEFTLAKSPVTHTSDPTAVGGARNSAEVIVDRVRWAERTGLFGAGAERPHLHHFDRRRTEDARALWRRALRRQAPNRPGQRRGYLPPGAG